MGRKTESDGTLANRFKQVICDCFCDHRKCIKCPARDIDEKGYKELKIKDILQVKR